MFAAPVLIDRSMTNFSEGVSGNGNRIKSKMAANCREKRTSITTTRDQHLSYATFPTPLFFHYPLPLNTILHNIKKYLKLRNALISGQHPHFQGEHEQLDTGYACLTTGCGCITTGSTLSASLSPALEMSSKSYFSLLGFSAACN
jgi:hypothetical protein